MRATNVKAVALALAVLTLCMGVVQVPRVTEIFNSNRQVQLGQEACQMPNAMLAALAAPSAGEERFLYVRSVSGAVDFYRTSWNTLIEIHLGQGSKQSQQQFGLRLLEDREASLSLGGALAKSLGLQILAGLNELPEHLEVADAVEAFIKDGATDEDKAAQIAEITTRFVANADGSQESLYLTKSRLSAEGAQTDAITHLEESLLRIPIPARDDEIRRYLEKVIYGVPNGAGLYALYLTARLRPDLIHSLSAKITAYLEALEVDGGGYSFVPGETYEPQVSYYALILGGTSPLNAALRQMKYQDQWLHGMGRMPLGTALLAGVVWAACGETLGKKHVQDDQWTNLYSCIESLAGVFPRDEVDRYLTDPSLGPARSVVLAKICGTDAGPSDSGTKVPGDVPQGGKGDPKHIFATLIAADKLEKAGMVDMNEGHVEWDGCKHQPASFDVDLVSTVACLGSRRLTEDQIAHAKATFLVAGVPSLTPSNQYGEVGSPEAVLLYALLADGDEAVAKLVVLI